MNILILVAVALLLFAPLLGYGLVPAPWIAALLGVRLIVQILRARSDPRLRRPIGWLVDVLLIVALLFLVG